MWRLTDMQLIMKSVGIVVFPEFQLLDVSGPLELLGAADGIRPVLVGRSLEPMSPANWSNHNIVPDYDFEGVPHLDALMVPGGPGVKHAMTDDTLLNFLRNRADRAVFVTSVCTGSLVLGAAGLLAGYKATTHWRYLQLLKMFGAIPVEGRVVRDRNRITAGGVTAGMDFGLEVAAALVGERQAQKAQLRMEYRPAPPFSSGHPDEAASDLVEELHLELCGTYDERERILNEVLEKSSRQGKSLRADS
jgi:cyclohexyl-isocyanide hydratase